MVYFCIFTFILIYIFYTRLKLCTLEINCISFFNHLYQGSADYALQTKSAPIFVVCMLRMYLHF